MKRDLGSGSITKNLLSLGWPMMLAFFLHTGFNIIDAMFVGRISSLALAAVSLSFPVMFVMIALGIGVGVGTTSLIARRFGEKKESEASNIAEHAYMISIILAVFFTSVGLLFGKQLFSFLTSNEQLIELSLDYMNIIFMGSIFTFLIFISNSILRGEGDMKTPMKVMIIGALLNVVFDPLLIFGWWIFPELGVKGAALATVLSGAIACIIALEHVFMNKSSFRIKLRDFHYDPQIIKDIFSVGLPTFLAQGAGALALFFMNKIVGFFGPSALAVYGAGFRLDSVAFMPAVGISTALVTIVGYNVGAKNFKRAEKTVWVALGLSFLFMQVIGLLFFLFPTTFIRLFSSDPQVLRLGVDYLRIVPLCYGFIGMNVLIGSAFQGAGKGYPAFVLTFLRFFVMAIPLSLFFTSVLHWGINSIWWALFISMTISAFISVLWFRSGTWKKGARPTE